jgi:hypothetical protein
MSPLFPILVLVSWGCALSLSTGRIGFMPLDQSIVFDGAWRLLSGQVPFRDFTTPDSLTPIVLQVLFFKVLGVNWFAYCLHAAAFNGLFCCLVFGLLRALGSSRTTALLYGGLSGVVFYPPFGTPYREQHAFFFVLMVLLMTVLATDRPYGWRTGPLWFLIPSAVALGYFSKQIPSLFVVPVLLLYLYLRGRDRAVKALVLMGVGTLAVVGALLVLSWATGADVEWVRVYFFQLPAALGKERLEILNEPGRLLAGLVQNRGYSRWSDPGSDVLLVLGLLVPVWYAHLSRRTRGGRAVRIVLVLSATAVLLAAAIGALVLEHRWGNAWLLGEIGVGLMILTGSGVVIAVGPGKGIRRVRRCLHRSCPVVVLAAGMSLTCVAVALLSSQAYENSVALVFAALGLVQVCLTGLAATVNKQLSGSRRGWKITRCLVRFMPWSVAVLAVIQAAGFHERVNVGRAVHQLEPRASSGLSGSIVSPALAFMVWDVPAPARHGASPREHAESVHRTLRFLEQQDGNFLLIGDSSILYALARRPSVSPSLWFHPGLTIPPQGTEAFERYQLRLMENMDRYGVRFVLLEGERTWVETRLSNFPLLETFVRRRRVGEHQMGPFTIVELSGQGRRTPLVGHACSLRELAVRKR